MALASPNIDYVAELVQIRERYVSATLRQRLSMVRHRLADNHVGANRLVTSVSAVEALARSLLQHLAADSQADLAAAYPRYKEWSAKSLVREYLSRKGISDLPLYFAEDNWKLFGYAVEYRNVLVHECTGLGQDKFPSLIEACEVVLDHLVKLANIREHRA